MCFEMCARLRFIDWLGPFLTNFRCLLAHAMYEAQVILPFRFGL
jgi:hypothetical protein